MSAVVALERLAPRGVLSEITRNSGQKWRHGDPVPGAYRPGCKCEHSCITGVMLGVFTYLAPESRPCR